jgi:hypothetical protein
MADTVINPSGGTAAFLEINLKACLKFQNESGHCGYSNRTFIANMLKNEFYPLEYWSTSLMRNMAKLENVKFVDSE